MNFNRSQSARSCRWTLGIRLAALAVASGLQSGAAAPAASTNDFETACVVYRAGVFDQAAEMFAAVAQARPSVGAYQNLGNAEWRRGRAGEAILAWEQARWLSPFNADVKANLRFARRATQLAAPELAWYEMCSTWLPVDAWAWIASGAFWLAVGLTVVPHLLGWRKAEWHQAVAAAGFAVFLLTLPALAGVQSRSLLGVIRTPDTPLRLTPTREAQVLVKLAPGETARLERARGDYLLVRVGNDTTGWVRREQFGRICGK